MSLDVHLIMKGATISKFSSGIFIRENGETKEISEEEWCKKNPDREPVRLQPKEFFSDEVYSANITHNLGTMASEADIYEVLWHPDENGITHARQLIDKLGLGLTVLKMEPERFKKFNPENGWGNYEGLARFVENYLNACLEHPDAEVYVSR